jgi:23S rRNA pseudouridine1911/1915/1917 synthase
VTDRRSDCAAGPSSDALGEERSVHFVVEPDQANLRLDRLIVMRVPELGRRAAGDLFREGRVRVSGRLAKKSQLSRVGERIDIELPEPVRAVADANLELSVRLETDDFVIVSKPAGQPSVVVPGSVRGTLASALLARYPEMASIGHGEREPGLLHRLDTGTSGLLIAARTKPAFEHLKALLSGGLLQKRYLAVVESANLPGSGVIDAEIMPHPSDRRRMRVATSPMERTAKPAHTRWQTQRRSEPFALLEVEVERALRHQIRVHLASVGHPIVGDALYGGRLLPELSGRHALHASYLGWKGDATLEAFEVEDALPEDMARLLGNV